MAIKDWTHGKINFEGARIDRWRNKNKDEIFVNKDVNEWRFSTTLSELTRTFSTKAQALKFVRAYMRKH